LGAIDAITRARLQEELADIQRKLRKTILFVTHDVEEALRLADKIVIMRAGTIVQYDTPLKIITQPRDTFVRDLTGADDVLRRLSLISVGEALSASRDGTGAAAHDGEPHHEALRPDDNLRDALSRLLRSGTAALPVVGPGGEQLGRLSLEALRSLAQDKEPNRLEDKQIGSAGDGAIGRHH
jgi:osmoprotectant transport system ATP-binding protein